MSDLPNRRVQNIQIVVDGPQHSVMCRGDLSWPEIFFCLDLLKDQVLRQQARQEQPRLDLKVRRMP